MKKLFLLFILINSAVNAQLAIDPVEPLCQNSPSVFLHANQPGGLWTGIPVVNASTGEMRDDFVGTHSICYTLNNDSVKTNITILPSVEVSFSYDTLRICKGEMTYLNPFCSANSATYSWSGASNANTSYIETDVEGHYNFTATLANGCAASTSIYVKTETSMPLFQNTDTICEGTSITLCSKIYDHTKSILWSTGSDSINITVSQSGTYTVTIDNNKGCVQYGSATVFVKKCDSMNMTHLNLNLQDQRICIGDSAVLNSGIFTNDYQIFWSNGARTSSITVAEGSYTVKVIAPNGDSASASVQVYSTPNPLTLHDTTLCSNAGLYAGDGGPSYTWTNPDNETFSAENVLWSRAKSGIYKVSVEKNGCTYHAQANITFVPFKLPLVIIPIDSTICEGRDFELKLTEQYASYAWDVFDYQSTLHSMSSSTSLAISRPAWVSLTVSDNNGCSANTVFRILTSNCDSTFKVKGSVFNDSNKNGIQDEGENGLAGISMWARNPKYFNFVTDSLGQYEFTAYQISNVQVGVYDIVNHGSVTTGESVITINLNELPEELTGQNFGFYLSSNDASTTIWANRAAPGFATYCTLSLRNLGRNALNNIHYKFSFNDSLLSFTGLNSHDYTIENNSISFDVDHLAVNQELYEYAYFTVKTGEENLGKTLRYTAVITTQNDEIASNDTCAAVVTIRGAFDPNFKESSFGDGAIAPSTKEIEYTIHFQNTGSDAAVNIVVKDSLDTEVFDLATLQSIAGSHQYSIRADLQGLLVVTFNNIMLPDSSSDEKGSHGFVKFKIALKNQLPLGTNIDNKAAIYFDFNSPIITNTAHNTLENKNSVQNINNQTLISKVYPNPTHGDATLEINGISTSRNIVVSVHDLLGKEVLAPISVANIGENNRINISSSALNEGLYFVKVSHGTSCENIPFVVHD